MYSLTTNRTYVGKTNNLERRLKQHNGELGGGAKATKNGQPWKRVCYITGFFTEVQALQFEWAFKNATLKCKNTNKKHTVVVLSKRLNGLLFLLHKPKYTSNCDMLSTQIPLTVAWTGLTDEDKLDIVLPGHVKLINM